MPLDPSIFARFAPAPKSVADYDLENAQVQGAQQANALNALRIQQGQRADQEAQRQLAEQTGMRNALSGLPSGAGDQDRINALYGLGTQTGFSAADTLRKAMLEQQKTGAEVGLKQADTQGKQGQNVTDSLKRYRSALDFIDTPQGAVRWLQTQYQDPLLSQHMQALGPFDQAAQSILTKGATPEGFAQWRQQAALGMESYMQKQGEAQTRAETARHNQADEANTVRGQNVTASTARQNNAANISKDYAIAGLNPDGTPSGTVESMAQMIAAGKSAPITGFALARPQGQMVMQRVMQINPQFDATDYAAKSKAARDFGTGSQGNAMRSFAVAGQHLDQLGTLVDALGNRDTQIVNKIANAYAEQTGNPAPTNFDAAKDIVSKEVVKAIVAGGGGVSEREELARLMSNAKSPAQLKGVIAQYRGLMGAQHDALLQQRRAAGLPDSTLPSYSGNDGGSGVPADIAAILQKHGTK